GREQRLAAAGADECAVALFRVQRTGAGTLGAVLAQHREGLRGQLLVPLLLAVLHGVVLRHRIVPAAKQTLHGVRPPEKPYRSDRGILSTDRPDATCRGSGESQPPLLRQGSGRDT